MPEPHPLLLITLLVPSALTAQQSGELDKVPGAPPASPQPGIEERFAVAAPDSGDWSSEDWAARAGARLDRIGELWASDELDVQILAPWVDPAARIARLIPADLEDQAQPQVGGLFTHRAAPGPAPFLDEQGPAAVLEAFSELGRAFPAPRGRKLKVIGVELSENGVHTRVAAAFSGRRASVLVEGHAEWQLEWRRAGEELVLLDLRSRDYAETSGLEKGGPLFRDVTAALLAREPEVAAQLAAGLEHWRARLDASLGVGLLGHHGVAVGDVDGDGLEDLYLAQPGGLPNLLLLATTDQSFRDATAQSGADFLDATRGVLLVDLDGDDDLDLVLGVVDEVLVLENDGKGRFTLRAAHPVPTVTSLAAADFDADGDLDLYACGYVTPYDDETAPVPYHDANNGQPNSLLVNGGQWRFHDATAALGLDANNRRFSFAAAWEDYDRDGDPDLYVANDFGRNNLYRNDGGRFADVAAEAGVEDIGAGMGVAWGDVDLDGWMDLYVSNMWSSAGQRVGSQERFHADAEPGERRALERHARGSSLFLGGAGGLFRDVSVESGVTLGRWAWGGLFVDLDDDPWLDLCVPNGFVTGARADDL